ncbi:TonB family protein [Hymenobacter norwichensis]|uniref:TonB family protein n=1 Tax=Hymenobacter norwichensis TaxID=223903 RepID=UPI0003B5B6BC|nr:TonB family protein [Hymenobacter norwichensis]
MKHAVLLVPTFLLPATLGWAQSAPNASADTVRAGSEVYSYAEQMPAFPGGQQALYQELSNTVRYPAEALQQRAEGKVYVSFVVSAAGRVQDAKAVKDPHPLLAAEAVRAVSSLPAFTPGKQAGKVVPVSLTLPITFRLPNNIDQLISNQAAAANGTQPEAAITAKFPGGPEALRTYLASAPYPEAASAVQAQGRVFIKFKIRPDGKPGNVKKAGVVQATQQGKKKRQAATEATNQLLTDAAIRWVQAIPTWAPATLKGTAIEGDFWMVPVTFGTTAPSNEPPVYAYADQMPVFAAPQNKMPLEKRLQSGVRYPAQALRNRQGGVVYLYFVVNETGQLEQQQIIQSAGAELDQAVLEAARQPLGTLLPARHQGQPVKVFYVVPFTFKITS